MKEPLKALKVKGLSRIENESKGITENETKNFETVKMQNEELDREIGELTLKKEELEQGLEELKLKHNMDIQNLRTEIEDLENKKNELENKTNSLNAGVNELERNKKEIEASIDELSKKEGKLKEIEDNLNDKIVDLDKRYIKNIKVMERLLHLSKATSNRYHEIVDALRWGYRREAINDNIKMSMFWATCLDEIYKAITDEEIKRAEEEMNSLNYEEIVECLVTVGEIIKDNLPRVDVIAIKAHDLNEEKEVREISKSQAKKILDIYRKEDEKRLNKNLKGMITELNELKLKIGNPLIQDMFVTPIINKLNSENSKLAMAMIVDSLKEYIKKYGSRY